MSRVSVLAWQIMPYILIYTTTTTRASQSCAQCNKNTEGHWLQCESCLDWCHAEYTQLPAVIFDLLDNIPNLLFVCDTCLPSSSAKLSTTRPDILNCFENTVDGVIAVVKQIAEKPVTDNINEITSREVRRLESKRIVVLASCWDLQTRRRMLPKACAVPSAPCMHMMC